MPIIKINVRNVDMLKPEADKVFYWDSSLRRFGVVVHPTGRKMFVVQYERHGKTRRVTIGELGKPWTVDQARTQARAVIGSAEQGEEISAGRRGLTKLSEVAKLWMARRVMPHRSAATIKDYKNKLDLHILPTFGDAAAVSVTRSDVVKWHAGMMHKPRTANYALIVLSGVYSFAIETGLIPQGHVNPATKLKKYAEVAKERFLSRAELSRLGDAIRDLEADERLSMYSAAALRLLIYTGARSAEIKTMQWQWVDFERGVVHLPVSKTGKKPIFLSGEAMAVLHGLVRVKGNPYVCVGQRDGQSIVSLQVPWRLVCERAGVTGCRIHDLRHTFASFAVAGGLSLPEVGKLLGHKTPATTQRYAHLSDTHAQQNNSAIGQVLGNLLNRSEPDGAKVIPIRRVTA